MVQAAKVSASDGSEEANIGLRSAEAEHLEHGDSDAEARSPQTRSGMQTSSDMPEHGGHSMAPPDWSPAGVQDMLMPYLNKGSISNLATFSVMLLGMMMTAATKAEHACPAEPETFGQAMARWVLAAGLFGFAGGITNWVAIKMLFDRVCNLPGSGVIPMRFKEIRQVIKDTIMKTFFDGPYLEQYMNKKMASLAGELNIGAKIKEMLEKPEVDAMITKALEELGSKPEGTMIMMMGIMPIQLKPLITPFLSSMADDIGPLLGQMFDMKSIMSVEKLRSEIDLLMTEKLLELTPEIVRDLLEEVMRKHLGCLIVWGNVFGALIGLVSTMAGYP